VSLIAHDVAARFDIMQDTCQRIISDAESMSRLMNIQHRSVYLPGTPIVLLQWSQVPGTTRS